MATCLSIINTVLERLGQSTVTSAMGATDDLTKSVIALCNEAGQELAAKRWVAQQKETSFTTLAAEDQGTIDSIAPGLLSIINDTIWNRSLRRPVFGPKTPQEWQQNKAFAINGPWSNFRIRAGHLYMFPVPSAGQSCYFEYVSRYWLTDSSGATGRETWSADDDIPLLDPQLIQLGTIWRWKRLKGFAYSEERDDYERRVLDMLAKDGSKDWLSLSNTKYDIFPAIVVPAGSWG